MRGCALSLAAFTLLLAIATPALSDPVNIVGRPGIIGADTIRVTGTRIRLYGIDSPERDQPCTSADGQRYACGQTATRALIESINGREVDCIVRDTDRYGRAVAVCWVDGTDINGWLVSAGWAVAYQKYSRDYVDEEDRARSARAGLWSGELVPPWDWRQASRSLC